MNWKLNPTAAAMAAMLCVAGAASSAHAQLRVMNWNITAYTSGRVADFQTALFATAPNGLRAAPDIIIAEEVVGTTASPTGANNFLALLNSTPGGFTDWARADYVQTTVNNGGTNSAHALFYRTSKVDLLTQTPFVAPSTAQTRVLATDTGSCSTCPPRDNHRWRVRLKGYSGAGAEIYLYSAHMKAGSTGTDLDRRNTESNRLRNDAATLPAGANFILGADLNMQSSSQTPYQTLTATGTAATRFLDPINTPGSWENNNTFRFVHTQDPVLGGDGQGMDSRLDYLMISPTLRDGAGIDYVGSPSAAYSTSTWNDTNHSFRAWGNDGSTYNIQIATTTNAMVGSAIANAIINSALDGGHLPVFLDLRIPARATVSTVNINLGTVNVGAPASVNFTVANGIDTALWDRGGATTFGGVERLQTLSYSMLASAGFSVPAGTFTRAAGAAANVHTVTMSTATAGLKTGTVTITSNALDTPTIVINLSGNVVNPPPVACNRADVTDIGDTGAGPDGQLTVDDVIAFVNTFSDGLGCPGVAPCNLADITDIGDTGAGADGQLTVDDIIAFFNAFSDGCL